MVEAVSGPSRAQSGPRGPQSVLAGYLRRYTVLSSREKVSARGGGLSGNSLLSWSTNQFLEKSPINSRIYIPSPGNTSIITFCNKRIVLNVACPSRAPGGGGLLLAHLIEHLIQAEAPRRKGHCTLIEANRGLKLIGGSPAFNLLQSPAVRCIRENISAAGDNRSGDGGACSAQKLLAASVFHQLPADG